MNDNHHVVGKDMCVGFVAVGVGVCVWGVGVHTEWPRGSDISML